MNATILYQNLWNSEDSFVSLCLSGPRSLSLTKLHPQNCRKAANEAQAVRMIVLASDFQGMLATTFSKRWERSCFLYNMFVNSVEAWLGPLSNR